ncbi:MAG: transcription elongation factor GreA [Dehalococcoidia bacterium]|nr:transcription elongation factor GreA [Dehalococcoidia bacterium]
MNVVKSITLSEATRLFISQMSEEERPTYQQELGRFLRWYGRDRRLQEVTPPQVDDYIQETQKAGGDYQSRLLPLRSFLAFAKEKGYTSTNLATIIKVKKSASRKVEGIVSGRPEQDVHYMSSEGHQRLQEELQVLKAKRPELANELHIAAADKDMRENAPYDAVKEKQGKIEARIRELEGAMKKVVVRDGRPASTARVQQGHRVMLRDLTTGEEVHYTLVSPREVDLMAGRISFASPMGRALLDKAVGDRVEVTAPQGALHYQVLAVE